jgi:hypothetical protein
MPNPENIEKHKWKKGQSGNPKGRPKTIPDLYSALANVVGEKKDEKTALDGILLRLRSEAMKGNIRAIELMLKYCFPDGIKMPETQAYEIVWGEKQGEGDANKD